MWTRFMDMHSGGGCKEPPFEYIYIEAAEEEAKVIFYNRFSHNPDRVTCTCCGSDYSVETAETLDEVSEYDRRGQTVEDYSQKKCVLIIPARDILPEQRTVEVPAQGYVWL